MSVRPKRLRFSVDDYYTMIGLGMLKNVERAEIIDGELIESVPIGNAHASCVKTLAEVLRDNLGKILHIRFRIRSGLMNTTNLFRISHY